MRTARKRRSLRKEQEGRMTNLGRQVGQVCNSRSRACCSLLLCCLFRVCLMAPGFWWFECSFVWFWTARKRRNFKREEQEGRRTIMGYQVGLVCSSHNACCNLSTMVCCDFCLVTPCSWLF
jgi:hypothetical protein